MDLNELLAAVNAAAITPEQLTTFLRDGVKESVIEQLRFKRQALVEQRDTAMEPHNQAIADIEKEIAVKTAEITATK